MCGISGFNFPDKEILNEMNKTLSHRGPDGEGSFFDDNISLGHNLLAITETPKFGQQPIISEDKNYVLIYNGEIYNYKVLRDELISDGINFSTDGDTEVLFNGLIRYGITFVSKIDGMYAFALYNKKNKTIILARDKNGAKPLYYYEKNGKFIFSSEIKGILCHDFVERKANINFVPLYFELGYIPGEETFIRDIKKIKPGEIIIKNLETGKIEKKNIEETKIDKISTSLEDIIGSSVLDHTMGLRPFGMYLSGGIDSSIVLYELLKKGIRPTTYTTRFLVNDRVFNEDADIALRLSRDLGADHNELEISENDFINSTEETIDTIEEPRYHPSIPAYFLMAKEASKKTTVILTGDGGDELFLGYDKYRESYKISEKYNKYPAFLLNAYYTWQNYNKKKISLSTFLNLDKGIYRWWYLSRIASGRENRFFKFNMDSSKTLDYLGSLSDDKNNDDIENKIAEYDRKFWLAEDSLIITDKIGMHFGMEGRFPILGGDIISYATNLSSRDKKIQNGTKLILKELYKDKLPKYVIEKKKTGWTAPVRIWMNSALGDFVRETLSEDYYNGVNDLFNFEEIRRAIPNDALFTQLSIKRFFPIFMFQIWARSFKITL